jgi:hypothetical protein
MAKNWFISKYSNAELADILSDYSKDVNGFRDRQYGAGRCTLAASLESLDAYVAAMTPEQRAAEGWSS